MTSTKDPYSGLRADIETIVDQRVRALLPRALQEALKPDEYLSTAAAAAAAAVSAGTIRRWVHAGKLTRHNAGREIRIRRGELEQFMRGGKVSNEEMTPEAAAMRDFG